MGGLRSVLTLPVGFVARYKMVQYFTKRFYAPFLVSAYANAAHGIFGASVINDDVDVAVSGEIRFTMHTWSGAVAGMWTVGSHCAQCVAWVQVRML